MVHGVNYWCFETVRAYEKTFVQFRPSKQDSGKISKLSWPKSLQGDKTAQTNTDPWYQNEQCLLFGLFLLDAVQSSCNITMLFFVSDQLMN